VSEKKPRRGRGPDLRPRRSRGRPVAEGSDSHSVRSLSTPFGEMAVEINRLYLLDDRLVRIDRRGTDGRLVVIDQDDGAERSVLRSVSNFKQARNDSG